ETQVCFRYYHGVTGALRATTPTVTIKKGFPPVSKPVVSPEVNHGLGNRRLINFSLSGRLLSCVHSQHNILIWPSLHSAG
ncbi:hypothetical protein CHARACLAT_024771, partial [Characodon lateralis]|nr:hypothetical protein [Characodon lateralis]